MGNEATEVEAWSEKSLAVAQMLKERWPLLYIDILGDYDSYLFLRLHT